MRFLFDEQWFKEKQGVLLWLLNAPLIKIWFRYCLRIVRNVDCSLKDKIIEITPNSFTIDAGLQYFNKSALLKTSWENPNNSRNLRRRAKKWFIKIKVGRYKDEKVLLPAYRIDFRTHYKYRKRILYAFRPLWKLCHAWDMLIANRFNPAWNLGFDTLTVYPDASTGATTMDGEAGRSGVNQTFANIIAGAGTYSNATGSEAFLNLQATTTSNQYSLLARILFTLKTSGLTADATISAAVFSVYGSVKENALGSTTLDICDSTPAADNNIENADYGRLGTTSFGNISYASFSTTGYNAITFNASGIAAISKTGITKLGARLGWDLAGNFGGTWANNQLTRFNFYLADYTLLTRDPKLVITYTLPAISSNIFMGCNF
jgi:hypothetical protein